MAALTDLPAWKALVQHQKEMASVHMRDLFQRDPRRFERFSIRLIGTVRRAEADACQERPRAVLANEVDRGIDQQVRKRSAHYLALALDLK